MKKALKWIGAGGVAALAALIVVGFFLPQEFHLVRSIMISAPPEKIHTYVGDLRQWETWSPWEANDPSMTVTLGEKTSGVGASQSWKSKCGTGSLSVTESDPDEGIAYQLFLGQGTNDCESKIRYEPAGSQTMVIWTMEGENTTPILGGYLSLLLDTMVGSKYEEGLMNLKKRVEAAP